MTASGRVRIEANLVQDGHGINLNIPDIVFAALSTRVAEVETQDLSTGNNTIATTNKSMVILIPPAGNTVVMLLKSVSGDTGMLMHLTNPTVLSITSPQNSIVINAASSISNFLIVSI